MVLVTNHIFDRGDIMNKKNCIMATVAAAALTSLSVFMGAIGVVLNVDRQSRGGDFRH